jgi:hypothetical protein
MLASPSETSPNVLERTSMPALLQLGIDLQMMAI